MSIIFLTVDGASYMLAGVQADFLAASWTGATLHRRSALSYYKQQMEAIRFHESAAAKLKDELYADIEVLFDEGIASRPSEENPVTAVGKFVQKLVPGTLVSGADLKEKVPATREISYRGLTAMLSQHPALAGAEEKDRHGLKCFRRIDELLVTEAAAE